MKQMLRLPWLAILFLVLGLVTAIVVRGPHKGSPNDQAPYRRDSEPGTRSGKVSSSDDIGRPGWATGFGTDHAGTWAEFTVDGVRTRLRWIRPGSFVMGSPLDEAYRMEWENQHEVRLTLGFWMAETECTQELWSRIMKRNPSRMTGPQLPVESSSPLTVVSMPESTMMNHPWRKC